MAQRQPTDTCNNALFVIRYCKIQALLWTFQYGVNSYMHDIYTDGTFKQGLISCQTGLNVLTAYHIILTVYLPINDSVNVMSCSNMPDVCFTFSKRSADRLFMLRMTPFFIKSCIKSTRSCTSAVNSASSIGRSYSQTTKGVDETKRCGWGV